MKRFLYAQLFKRWKQTSWYISLLVGLALFGLAFMRTSISSIADMSNILAQNNSKIFLTLKSITKISDIPFKIIKSTNPDKLPEASQLSAFITVHPKEEGFKSDIAYIDLENNGFSSTKISEIEVVFTATPSSVIQVFSDTDNDKQLSSLDENLGTLTNQKWRKNKLQSISSLKLNKFFVATKTDFTSKQGIIQQPFSLDEKRHRLFLVSNTDFDLIDVNFKTRNAVTLSKTQTYAVRLVDDETFRYLNHLNRSREEFLADNPIFKSGPANSNQIILEPGVHFISQTTIVPNTVELIIQPGTNIRFSKDTSLVSYGKVIAEGTQALPITLTSLTNEPWGVFGIVGNQASNSLFAFVTVENASQDYINGIYFSGGLAIHYADSTITNSTFRSNTGDDGLNIKHARTIIKNSSFVDNQFDGVDLDVVTGEIKNNQFTNNGNDGLDISFSTVNINDNQITSSSDKCISVGEKSFPTISNNTLTGCGTGIAVKDLSEATITSNTFQDNNIAVAAYQKKDIFGGSVVRLKDNTFLNNQKDFDISDNSTLIEL